MQPSQELKQLTDLLLSDESNWGERRECLQQMHCIFVELNHFDAYEPAIKTDEEWLSSRGTRDLLGCSTSAQQIPPASE